MAFLSIAQPLAICQHIFIIVFFILTFFEKSIAFFKKRRIVFSTKGNKTQKEKT